MIVKALLFAAVLSVVLASAVHGKLPGANRCTWGPAYWCAKVPSAKECGAVNFCITQWKSMQITSPAEPSAVCSMSTLTLSAIQNYLEQEKDVLKVAAHAKQSCQRLTHMSRAFDAMCQVITEKHLEEVLVMSLSGMKVEQISHLLGFCDNKRSNLKLERPKFDSLNFHPLNAQVSMQASSTKNPLMSKIECDVCRVVVEDLKEFVRENTTEKEFLAFVKEALCSRFGKVSTECHLLVDALGSRVYDVIKNNLDSAEVCQTFQACPASSIASSKKTFAPVIPKRRHHHSVKVNNIECQICTQVITYADSFLESNRTETDVEKILDKVCEFLPSAIRSECDQLINQYTPTLIQLLVAEFSPQQICQVLRLCSAKLYRIQTLHKSNTSPASCMSGPKYWCQSVTRAQLCGPDAVKLCKKYYWKS